MTDQSLHPYHIWHKAVASRTIQDQNTLNNETKLNQEAKKIWDIWYGEKRLHQEPAYPYFLASIFGIFGEGSSLIFFIQVLFSLGSLWLILKMSEYYFTKEVAVLSGLIFAFLGPSVFYDGVLLRASMISFTTLGLVYFAEKLAKQKQHSKIGIWPWVFGIFAGLALLLKSSFLLLFIFLFGFLCYRKWKQQNNFIKPAIAIIAGLLIAISPLAIRNLTVGAPVFSSSSVGAITYINSNVPSYDPYSGFTIDFDRSAEIMQQTNGKFISSVGKSISSFDSFLGFIGLQVKKLGAVLHWNEIPNNTNFYYYKLESPALRVAFIRFPFLLFFSLIGIVFQFKKSKKLYGLHWAILFQFVMLIGFYVISRFKMPLQVAMIPFAGFGIYSMIKILTDRDWKSAIWFLPAIILTLFVLRPLPEHQTQIRRIDVSIPFQTEAVKRLDAAADKKDPRQIAAIYDEYIQNCPKQVLAFSKVNPPKSFRDIEITKFYQNLFSSYAEICAEIGQKSKSETLKKEARKLSESLN
jgi:4-amino-4-deoxy-L-arabinose transferase-like glycosyltransferase